MRIILATPLYPPDVAEPAPYVKELAKRLSASHQVRVVAFGHLLEKVPGVETVAVSKNRPLPLRLWSYTTALWRAARWAEVVYALNGASVELPAGLIALFTRTPLVMCIGDLAAHERASKKWQLGLIERFATKRARATIRSLPLIRPEILPLEPAPTAQLAEYETSWNAHLTILEKVLGELHAHGD